MANTKITSGVIADNAVGITQLNVSDGSDGQALVTNGAGTLSFASVGVSGISSSADATAITIDSSENVGIGTTSPSSPNSVDRFLHIHDADHCSIVMSDDQNTWEIVSNNTFTIRDGTDTRLNISPSGEVGIGTTSPATTLHLDASGGAVLRMQRTSANASNKLELSHDGTDGTITSTNNLLLGSRVGINRTPGVANSKLEVGGADNVPLINVEASGNTAGIGIGSNAMKFYYGTSEKMSIGTNGDVTFAGGINVGGAGQFNANTIYAENLYVAEDIGHKDDSNTYMSFENDYLGFYTGGNSTMVMSNGIVTKPTQPAFDVAKNNGYQADDNNFIQDQVRTNVGSHYSTSTGRFTAPVAGQYLISFRIFTHDSGGVVQAEVTLKKNGGNAFIARAHKVGGYHTPVQITKVITLAANDYIQTYVGDSGTSSGWMGSAGEYNYFSGFLIS